MKNFIRISKLSNIAGRADYISNPERQESILAVSDPIDWVPYHKFEMQNKKTKQNNNEGRELIIALPNSWAELTTQELVKRANQLSHIATGKTTDQQWAIHWNQNHTNLHMHVIFSERCKKQSTETWDRDVYLTQDGKIARSKATRARFSDGTIKPPIHKKGDLKADFTSKDPKYKTKQWLFNTKTALQSEFIKFGTIIDNPEPMHQFHEGKGSESQNIRLKNSIIKINNLRLRDLAKISTENRYQNLVAIVKSSWKNGKINVLHVNQSGNLYLVPFLDPQKALKFAQESQLAWERKISQFYYKNTNKSKFEPNLDKNHHKSNYER